MVAARHSQDAGFGELMQKTHRKKAKKGCRRNQGQAARREMEWLTL